MESAPRDPSPSFAPALYGHDIQGAIHLVPRFRFESALQLPECRPRIALAEKEVIASTRFFGKSLSEKMLGFRSFTQLDVDYIQIQQFSDNIFARSYPRIINIRARLTTVSPKPISKKLALIFRYICYNIYACIQLTLLVKRRRAPAQQAAGYYF